MKLKSQRPAARRAAGRDRRGARPAAGRGRGRMAARPGVPVRRRVARRLPPLPRVLALLAGAAVVAGLVVLINGPWLRVGEVAWQGARFTPATEVHEALEAERGRSLLAVDTRALGDRLEALPSVLEATVDASLTGVIQASLVEREVAFVWETRRTRLYGADDGTLFAVEALDARLDRAHRDLPLVNDARDEGRLLTVGDRIPAGLLRTATALAALDPATLGSRASALSITLDDAYGFRVRSDRPGWEAAFGVSGLDPRESATAAAARLERQVTAVRTLFASRNERGIEWVDVRNPGKVYFRAKG